MSSKDTLAAVNRAIACPVHLTTPDGRKLIICEWSPKVDTEEIVTVSIKVIVEIPE